MSGIPMVQEALTGAAIDAARISTSTAEFLVAHDASLPPEVAFAICERLNEVLQWLHAARELMPLSGATSMHVIQPTSGGLLITP